MRAKMIFTDEEIKAILTAHFYIVLKNLGARVTHVEPHYASIEVTISDEKEEE